jgi:ribosomal protein L16 Arg81 hydroxylase
MATPYKVELKEGECLYLPAFWHHEVKSFPDRDEHLNVAVNFWFKNVTAFAEEGAGLAAAKKAQAERRRQRKERRRTEKR